MLFLSLLKNRLNMIDTELTIPLLSHIQNVVQNVSIRATELASHCGRKNVSVKDVAQASSGLCLTCAPYDTNSNTCNLITTSAQQRGGSSLYEDWCGGNSTKQQCGVSSNAICLFTGGRRRKRKKNTRTKIVLKKRSHPLHCNTLQHEQGGDSHYQGFCGQPFNLTQCMFADNDSTIPSSTTCSGGRGKRATHPRQSTRRRSMIKSRAHATVRGGSNFYTGFCGTQANGNNISQCVFGDNIDSSSSSGGAKRRKYRPLRSSKRKGGQKRFDNMNLLNKTRFKQHMKQKHNMNWPQSSLHFLEKVIAYHINDVVERVNDEKELHILDTQKALENVLFTYK